ncbi:Regulatory protein rop [compost metagenome]
MTKQEQTALNMAKFIQGQSLLLLEKLNELDREADMCEKLHEDAEHFCRTLSGRLHYRMRVNGKSIDQ